MRIPTIAEWNKLVRLTKADKCSYQDPDVIHARHAKTMVMRINTNFINVKDTPMYAHLWANHQEKIERAYKVEYVEKAPGTYKLETVLESVATPCMSLGEFRPVIDLSGDDPRIKAEAGTRVPMGTLYMGGNPVRVPMSDSEIAVYIPDAKLELGPAEDDPQHVIYGYRVNNAIIADRCMIQCISHNTLRKALSPVKDQAKTVRKLAEVERELNSIKRRIKDILKQCEPA